jgi:excisionase family DNA binding protein
MSIAFVRSIIELVKAQWRPYNYEPEPGVYVRLKCPYVDAEGKKKGRKRPFWFVRGDTFICVACFKGCSLIRPEGFIAALPVQYAAKRTAPFQLSPAEMVARKALLRVDEAAYCLNISERQVYDWIAEGKLRRAKEQPVRVSAEDVHSYMANFAE